MTKLLLPSLLATLGASSTLLAQNATPPPASPALSTPKATTPKPPGNPAPATPPGDPFVRDPRAAKPPEPHVELATPVNLLTTVETWSLSQADFTKLLEVSASERAPYDYLEVLAKAGKAKLIGLIAVNTKPGQRARTESIDEVRFASEFDPPVRAGEIAFPTAYETRNTGDTLEIEPNIGPDGETIDVDLVPQSVRFDGFQDWKPEDGVASIGQPQFRTEIVATSMSVHTGRPAFLATATSAGTGDEGGAKEVRVRALRVTAQPVRPINPFPGEKGNWVVQLRTELLIYSLDREAARRILNDSVDSAQSHAAVHDLVAKGEAQLEIVSGLVVKPGQRGVNEEIMEFRYPTGSAGPFFVAVAGAAESRQPASLHSFETRNTGVTLELEPNISPEQSVDLNIVPQVVRMTGLLKASGVATKYPPQPVFTTRKITTSVSSAGGVPVLLGTMSQPRDTGVNDRKDDGRTSLAYIRVTIVRP